MKRLLAAIAAIAISLSVSAHEFATTRGCGTPDYETRLAMYGPSWSKAGSDCSATSTNPTSAYDPGTEYEITVVVHVITNGSTGQISDAMVASQIEILNEDFNALAGTNGANGTNTGIKFKLATVDPNGNPTNGITRNDNSTWFNDGGNYYDTLAWDTSRYMNIYTNNGGGALGYVPSLPANGNGSIVGTKADRVVVLWNTFGRNAPNSPFNLGRTATHEVGHYLGLEHTFNGGCSSASAPGCYTSGDLICDTEPEQSPNYGNCSGGNPNSCGDPDPITNYMDYSDDACMTRFSVEQMRRMRCTLGSWRSGLVNTGGSGNQSPTVSFTVTKSDLTASFTATASDSDGTIASYAWNFGDGNTSTAQNPSHTYASDGDYTVTVTVTDNDGATATSSQTVSVSLPGGSNILISGTPVNGLSGNTGDWTYYSIQVPANATKLTIATSGGSGDADLYVRSGSKPTTSAYDCRPYQNGNAETCTQNNPAEGIWWVGIRAYSNYSNVTLLGTIETGSTACTPFSDSVTNISGASGTWTRYTQNVPACASNLSVAISGGSGDADLYLRQGSQPTTSSYDCRPYRNGNSETCNVNNPASGTWHIGLRGYNAFSGVTLQVSYQ